MVDVCRKVAGLCVEIKGMNVGLLRKSSERVKNRNKETQMRRRLENDKGGTKQKIQIGEGQRM